MTRIEHLSADVFGLDAPTRAALSGQLERFGVATKPSHVRNLDDPFLPAERANLAERLEAKATKFGPHVRVLESIRSLATPHASCVVTEATPHVLGGPSRQLFAALQTIAMAQRLSTDSRPVVPVLWLRSDEFDARPLITSWVLNRHNKVQGIHLNRISDDDVPVRSVELSAEQHGIGSLREALRQLFGDFEHITPALDTFVPRESESLSGAYARTMYDLLGEQGLIIVEPEDLREGLSRAAADIVAANVEDEFAKTREMRELQQAKLPAAHEPWLFQVAATGRRGLAPRTDSPAGNAFSFEDEPGSRTRAELAAELVQTPQEWHMAHLFESVTRATVLPVLAEVGGPGELPRHVLFHCARETFGWPEPVFVPRANMTLVDAPSFESLKRLELTVEGVLRRRGDIAAHGLAPQTTELLEAIDQIAMDARMALKEQKPALLDIGPTLKPALRAATTELTAALRGLSKKISYVAANRGGKLDRHRRRLSNGLCPIGGPQADTLGPFQWLARDGNAWLRDLIREIDPFSPDHLAVFLD